MCNYIKYTYLYKNKIFTQICVIILNIHTCIKVYICNTYIQIHEYLFQNIKYINEQQFFSTTNTKNE